MEDIEFNSCLFSYVNAFSVIHLNIRSLSKNVDKFLAYLSQLCHKFLVIAISETWATESNDNFFKIPVYNNILKNRTTSTGGVVVLDVLDRMSYEIGKDCTLSKTNPLFNINGRDITKTYIIDHLIPIPISFCRIFKKLLKLYCAKRRVSNC